MTAYLAFAAVTVFVLLARAFDAYITIKAQKDGYGKESTGLVATKGKFSFWKATLVVGIIEVAFWIAFPFIEHTADYVAIACIWQAGGGVVSWGAYFSNKKDIRNRKPNNYVQGGIV